MQLSNNYFTRFINYPIRIFDEGNFDKHYRLTIGLVSVAARENHGKGMRKIIYEENYCDLEAMNE